MATHQLADGDFVLPWHLQTLNSASGEVGIQVIAEIYQRVPDGFGMPVEWALSIVVAIVKEWIIS